MIFAVILAVVLLCSCTRKVYVETEREVYRTDTLRAVAYRADTLIQRDSVFMLVKGDTVRIERWRDRWRVQRLTDTVKSTVRDSIRVPVTYEVVKEVERPLHWWQKALMWLGAAALLLCGIGAWKRFKK